jgi:hypothetical protein
MAGVALVWPYLGPKLMDDNTLTFWQMLGGFIVPPLIVIGGLKEALKGGKIPAPKPTKGHCVRPDEDKDEFVCVQPFETDGVPIGGATPRLHDHFGRPDGLVLLGDMFWTQRLARDYRLTEIDTNAFRLTTPQLSCSQVGPLGLAWIVAHPDWFVTYDAIISLRFEREALPADNAQWGEKGVFEIDLEGGGATRLSRAPVAALSGGGRDGACAEARAARNLEQVAQARGGLRGRGGTTSCGHRAARCRRIG